MAAENKLSKELTESWKKLEHKFKVIRKEGIVEISIVVSEKKDKNLKSVVQRKVLELGKSERWQDRQSCFLLAQHLLSDSPDFCEAILKLGQEKFEDEESYVREAVAEMMEPLAKQEGIRIYETVHKKLVQLIVENFKVEEAPENSAKVVEASIAREKRVLEEKLRGLREGVDSWKLLFTAFTTLEKIVWGLGQKFEKKIDESFLDLIHRCSKHINRFVREASFSSYGAVIAAMTSETFEKFGERIAKELESGLGDNWSQVRHASSVSTRSFCKNVKDLEPYYRILLPAMCLNRYYVAAGVRIYSQETWKSVYGEEGKEIVAKFAKYVTEYYVSQAKADNHAVREAACHCIAELGSKVRPDAISEFIPVLLDALIACFKDESWPVRDAACLALGAFVSVFPKESEKDLEELFGLWFEHLSDNIPSVRKNTAVALGKVLNTFKEDVLKKILVRLNTFLPMVNNQTNDAKKFGEMENTTIFGVAAKKKRDNDPVLHTGQPQYSCGSLAPKMKRATRCGCMDHGFAREREPWEYTDGAIYLLPQVVAFKPDLGIEYLPKLAKIADLRHFAQYQKLQETIWKIVPEIAKGMGKKEFKRQLKPSSILNPCVETLKSGTMLSKSEAGKCLSFCYQFLGESIFESRLTEEQVSIVRRSPHVRTRAPESQSRSMTASYFDAMARDMKDNPAKAVPKSKNQRLF